MTITVKTALIRDKALLSRSIGRTAQRYQSVKEQMHTDACSALFWAFTHNCPSMLNKMFSGLTDNYQASFRAWLGDMSAFERTIPGATGDTTKSVTWIKFKKNVGFTLVSGPDFYAERQRLAKLFAKVDTEMDVVPFYVKGDKAKGADIDTLTLLKKLLSSVDGIVKKADSESLVLPDGVARGIKSLAIETNRSMAVLASAEASTEVEAEAPTEVEAEPDDTPTKLVETLTVPETAMAVVH